jgi:hypothetical protein
MANAQERGRGGRGQGRGGFGGGFGGGLGGGGPLALLAIEEVQKELKITDEQKKQIETLASEQRGAGFGGAGGGQGGNFRDLSPEERQKRIEEFRKQAEARAKEVDEKIKGILNADQSERLGELRLQREGINAFNRSEVADKLGLSKEQREKIAKLLEDARPGFGRGGGFGAGGGRGGAGRGASEEERAKAIQEARERREKLSADVLGVLNDGQKAAWEEMQGKKFDFPEPQRRGGRGGRDRQPQAQN